MPDSGRCCCLAKLLEDRARTGCWRISALKCAGTKLVGLGSLEWGERSVCSLNWISCYKKEETVNKFAALSYWVGETHGHIRTWENGINIYPCFNLCQPWLQGPHHLTQGRKHKEVKGHNGRDWIPCERKTKYDPRLYNIYGFSVIWLRSQFPLLFISLEQNQRTKKNTIKFMISRRLKSQNHKKSNFSLRTRQPWPVGGTIQHFSSDIQMKWLCTVCLHKIGWGLPGKAKKSFWELCVAIVANVVGFLQI